MENLKNHVKYLQRQLAKTNHELAVEIWKHESSLRSKNQKNNLVSQKKNLTSRKGKRKQEEILEKKKRKTVGAAETQCKKERGGALDESACISESCERTTRDTERDQIKLISTSPP